MALIYYCHIIQWQTRLGTEISGSSPFNGKIMLWMGQGPSHGFDHPSRTDRVTDGPKSVLLPIHFSVREDGRERRKRKKKTDRKLQLSNDATSKAVSTVFHMWESGKWEVDCSREYLMTHFIFFYFSELFHAMREREWERTREAMGKAYECHSNLTLSKRQWWIRRLTVSLAPGHC